MPARTVRAISNADGRFSMELPPGGYALAVRREGYGPATAEISVTSNAEFQLAVPTFRLVRANPPAIMPPRKLAGAPPLYPEPARRLSLRHVVIVDLIVGSDGTVADVKVLRGHALLNQAAIDAVALWRFTPTVLNGEPVDVQLTATVSFPPRAQRPGGLRAAQSSLLLPRNSTRRDRTGQSRFVRPPSLASAAAASESG